MAVILSTTYQITEDEPQPPVRADVRTRPAGFGLPEGTAAAVVIGDGRQEVRLAGTPEQLDQLLRDALNALGEATDAHEQTSAAA